MADPQTPVRFVPGAIVSAGSDSVQRHAAAPVEATTAVDYHSTGHLLVIGPASIAIEAAGRAIGAGLAGAAVFSPCDDCRGPQKRLTDRGVAVIDGSGLALAGHLGAFVASIDSGETAERTRDLAQLAGVDKGAFDLVLDLGAAPAIGARLPPFGYRAPRDDETVDEAIETLAALVGTFEKPRYFSYDASICAHSRSGITACTRCQTVCAADAIRADGDGVAVDPYRCQGCGTCATVCPTGAMTYAWPKPADAIAEARRRVADSGATILLLYRDEDDAALAGRQWPAGVLPLAVEEVTAFGLDFWLAMLAGGVGRILLLVEAADGDPDVETLRREFVVLDALLAGLGLEPGFVATIDHADLERLDQIEPLPRTTTLVPKRFSTHNDKRQTVRSALDALAPQWPPVDASVPLPANAPFGRIRVDTDACTLCMGCVSLCPGKALLDGQDMPALRLVEANCVQCGLCESACPESAISLEPRYLYDSLTARKTVTLHEEPAFHCVRCHKPFATKRMIDRMQEKLAGHWMFQDATQRRRLSMCEDCRVRDMFEGERQGIDVHRGPT